MNPTLPDGYCQFEGRVMRTSQLPDRARFLPVYENGTPTGQTVGDLIDAARAKEAAQAATGREHWKGCEARSHLAWFVASDDPRPPSDAQPTIQTLTSCRDHWKAAFDHERANVIRLRKLLYEQHRTAGHCNCEDCQLVRDHAPKPPA